MQFHSILTAHHPNVPRRNEIYSLFYFCCSLIIIKSSKLCNFSRTSHGRMFSADNSIPYHFQFSLSLSLSHAISSLRFSTLWNRASISICKMSSVWHISVSVPSDWLEKKNDSRGKKHGLRAEKYKNRRCEWYWADILIERDFRLFDLMAMR